MEPGERRRAVGGGSKEVGAVVAGLVVLLALPAAAAFSRVEGSGLRLCGAGDLMPVGQAIARDDPTGEDFVWTGGTPGTRLDALRSGACDAVLMAYEPAQGELDGLRADVLARDAIVFLIDENTYEGGTIRSSQNVARMEEPLRGLSLADLRGILGYYTAEPDDRWTWPGKYERWETYVNEAGRTVKIGTGNALLKGWQRQTPVILVRQTWEPGRFDTQTALYRLLGLEEDVVSREWTEFSHADMDREEEVLATEYGDANLFAAGQGDFQFRVTYASLRVARLATRNVPVRPLAIEGVDPIAQAEAVRAGDYPLLRDVRIVRRDDASPSVEALAGWLSSEEGQAFLGNLGFVPLGDVLTAGRD